MNDWSSINITRHSLVKALFSIREIYGICHGKKKIVIVVRDDMWTSDTKRKIERMYAICYPPLGFDLEARAEWRKKVYG